MNLSFEWDPDKAARNLAKHRIAFDEAATIFGDPLVAVEPDRGRHPGEARYRAIGWSSAGRTLVVSFTERGESIRIISARPATRSERRKHAG
jgi:uncharacterized protein